MVFVQCDRERLKDFRNLDSVHAQKPCTFRSGGLGAEVSFERTNCVQFSVFLHFSLIVCSNVVDEVVLCVKVSTRCTDDASLVDEIFYSVDSSKAKCSVTFNTEDVNCHLSEHLCANEKKVYALTRARGWYTWLLIIFRFKVINGATSSSALVFESFLRPWCRRYVCLSDVFEI